ncbi:MAG: glycosyltransferase, partial [Planctomycetales bacterium]|nr:glycosyltransferase [Planctomycetales bacterium]
DGGIADAFNKGVQRATGELVAILNSDDWYADGAINRMVAAHQTRLATNQSPAILHGDSVWHWPESIPNRPAPRRIRPRLWGGRDQVGRAFWFDMPVNHPTCFVPSSIYQRVGLFDTDYRVAMDFDWMLRAFLAGARFAYVPEVITHFQTGGVSGQHTRLAIREVCRAQQRSRVYPFRRRVAYWGKMSVNRLKSLTGVRLLPGSAT